MSNIYEEYLNYDAIGMIGSVGGTLGMFIGFSMTGVISWIFVYLKSVKFSLDFFGHPKWPEIRVFQSPQVPGPVPTSLP